MLKEVDCKTWESELVEQDTSVFDSVDYLQMVSELYETTLKYWIVYKNKKPIIGFATHVKSKAIIVPNHFSYSSFWVSRDEINGFSFFEHLDAALILLKSRYKFITFRLPPHIRDIRAFNLQGFSVKVSYTYLKELGKSVAYRSNVVQKLKQADKQSFSFLVDQDYRNVLNQHTKDFPYFDFTKKQSDFYVRYFDRLIKTGFLKSFVVYNHERLIASALVILDTENRNAYNLLLSSSKNNNSTEASTFLYHNMLKHLAENGYDTFDFYGADMKGIANYKAGFRGNLQAHYTVSYSFVKHKITSSINGVKKLVKSFL